MITLKILFNRDNSLVRWIVGWIPLWSYSAVVIEGAVLPPEDFPRWALQINDKVAHGVEYFLLFLIAMNAFSRSRWRGLRSFSQAGSLAYCFLMGVLTEILQRTVPGRSMDFMDWLADVAGAVVAWAVLFFAMKIKLKTLDTRLEESHA